MRFFDGFTLVEPGLVPPARWRPDLHDPLRTARQEGDEGEFVLQRGSLESSDDDDRGIAWHLCGIGITDPVSGPGTAAPLTNTPEGDA